MRHLTRVLVATLVLLLFATASAWSQSPSDPPQAPSATKAQQQSLVEGPEAGTPAMSPGDKFKRFALNASNPYQVVFAATRAGISQAADTIPGYGQGGEGYAKRFGAAMGDEASSEFFGTFLYPVLFHQDPRYFRKGTGTAGSRIGYAISRVFITRGDNGNRQFNISKILGCGSAAAMSNAYYPDDPLHDERTAGKTMERFGINLVSTAGFNILKEFWPSMAHKVGN